MALNIQEYCFFYFFMDLKLSKKLNSTRLKLHFEKYIKKKHKRFVTLLKETIFAAAFERKSDIVKQTCFRPLII